MNVYTRAAMAIWGGSTEYRYKDTKGSNNTTPIHLQDRYKRNKKHYTEQFAKYDTYRKEHNLNGRQMAKVLGVKYADLRDCLIGTKIHGHVMTTIKEL